jgi:Tfp pilus assembly protein PilE
MKRHGGGFTVVEVMMFLSISGAMFLIAFFSTRHAQGSVIFRDSLNSVEAKLTEVFNNVDNGYFSNTGDYRCYIQAHNIHMDTIAGSDYGGNNEDCVYLGKVIDFTDQTTMLINTIVGPRDIDTYDDVATAEFLPERYNVKNSVDYTSTLSTGGLRIKAVRTNSSAIADIRANRYYTINGGTNWNPIDSDPTHQPILCFALGDERKGSIMITANDIKVNYDYSGSCW